VLQQVEQQGGLHSTAGARPPDLRVGRMGNKEIFCMPLQIKDIKFPAEHPPGESWKIHICPRTGCRARSAAGTLSGKDRVPRLVKLYYPYRTNSRAYHATYAQTFLNDIVTQLDIAHIQPLPSPGAIFYFVQNAAVSILQCSRHLWLPKQWAIRLGAEFHLSGTHLTIKNQVFIDLQLKNLQLCQHSFLVNNESTSYAMGSNYNVGNAVGDVFDFVIICGEIRAGGLGFGEILRNWA
jgi:hypothetical protein